MKKIKIFTAVLFLSLFLQTACAPKQTAPVKIFWPPLPDEPKISFVRSIKSLSDLQDRSFLDVLLGTSNVKLFKVPYGVSASGNRIYVSDSQGSAVIVADQVEKAVRLLPRSSDVRLKVPMGVAAGEDGTVFIADADHGTVLVFDNNGSYKGAIGKKGEMIRPVGLALNTRINRIYVTDVKRHMIHVYSVSGERLFSFGKVGVNDGEFAHPTNIAIDRRNDNVLVTDTNNFRVQIFDKDGKFLSKFGELGDQPGMFSRPKGIGVDSDGNIYVVDAAFGNIQVFSEEGRLLTIFGKHGFRPGEFQLPAGLYVGENDRIYVVDQINTRVQVFQYLSEKWKKEHPDEYNKIYVGGVRGK